MSTSQNFQLGIIGNKNSIALYKSLGVIAHAVESKQEATNVLESLIQEFQDNEKTIPRYAVIFMEESYYKQISDDLIIKLARKALPALIPVPSPESQDPQFGLKRISKIVERAVGTDIS